MLPLQIIDLLGLRALEIPTLPRTGMSIDALRYAIERFPEARRKAYLRGQVA